MQQNENACKDAGREAFDLYVASETWEGAVQACDIMFLIGTNRIRWPRSGGASGWRSPIQVDRAVTVVLLQHVVDDTPPDSDGAAVAAVAAHYIVGLCAREGKERENLLFYTNQLLATVSASS